MVKIPFSFWDFTLLAAPIFVSHANDSYFWVVTGLSKMSVKQGYKLQTLGILVEGGAAAITLWIISLVVL